jgi:hypothetical protein
MLTTIKAMAARAANTGRACGLFKNLTGGNGVGKASQYKLITGAGAAPIGGKRRVTSGIRLELVD